MLIKENKIYHLPYLNTLLLYFRISILVSNVEAKFILEFATYAILIAIHHDRFRFPLRNHALFFLAMSFIVRVMLVFEL